MSTKIKLKSKTANKHAGGPFKRTGPQAEEWNKVIGPALEIIPATQLPTVRTVLQRYRALRIKHTQETTEHLAKSITKEVCEIWDKARIPTPSFLSYYKKLLNIIKKWKSHHNRGELQSFQSTLNSLLDLKPKLRGRYSTEAELEHLKKLMKQNSGRKRKHGSEPPDWETDFNFYLDQFQVNIKSLRQMFFKTKLFKQTHNCRDLVLRRLVQQMLNCIKCRREEMKVACWPIFLVTF